MVKIATKIAEMCLAVLVPRAIHIYLKRSILRGRKFMKIKITSQNVISYLFPVIGFLEV